MDHFFITVACQWRWRTPVFGRGRAISLVFFFCLAVHCPGVALSSCCDFMALPWWLGFMGTDFNWLRKNVSPLESSPSTTQRESQSNGVSDFLAQCNGLLRQAALNCVRQTSVRVRLIDSQQLNFISPYFFFILKSVTVNADSSTLRSEGWGLPRLSCNTTFKLQKFHPSFFLMCTSQGHRCGVFISCNHCVTLNCSLRSNNINFFGPLCWGKYPLSLPTQPEPSNLRPPPLHTPMEMKVRVGDSWPLLRTDCCTRVQLKGKCFCAFQGRLPGTDRTETFRYKKRFKTTFKGRINHVNESLRGSKCQLPLFDLPVFTLSALVSKRLLESGGRSYWSL